MKEKERPEPRIERGTSRRYAWVISLSENHTTRPPGLLLYLPIQIKLHRMICVTSHVNYNLITVASKNFSPARICLDYKYIANQHRNVVSVGARVTSSVCMSQNRSVLAVFTLQFATFCTTCSTRKINNKKWDTDPPPLALLHTSRFW